MAKLAENRKILFISDLHLEESHGHITQQFLQLLKLDDVTVDALYILGDLFETWIGDDDNTPFHRNIIAALKQATAKGLPIYIMHGNRDFLIGKRFMRETGCKLLADEEKIDVFGTPVLLMHGDTLCTQDIAYLKARKKAHNYINQFLFLLLPLTIRKKIAAKLRAKSFAHTQATPANIMDVTQAEVECVMAKHDVDYLIHGHTHAPDIHTFTLNGKTKTRIVLASWHEKGSMFVWDIEGNKKMVDLTSH